MRACLRFRLATKTTKKRSEAQLTEFDYKSSNKKTLFARTDEIYLETKNISKITRSLQRHRLTQSLQTGMGTALQLTTKISTTNGQFLICT